MKNKITVTLSIVIMSLALLSIISAFGVSSPYWSGNPLKMDKGETKTVPFNLQNKAGATEDVTVNVQLIQGSEIATLLKEEYVIEAGGENDILLTVSISEEAETGTTYPIELKVKTKTTGDAGGVEMGTGMGIAFNVVVTEEVVEKGFLEKNWFWIVLAIVIVALILTSLKKRKTK